MLSNVSSSVVRAAIAVAAGTLLSMSVAQAAAVSGQGTWETTLQGRDLDGNALNGPEAYYDTALNITWLTDANQAKTSGHDADGMMSWSAASAWAANLNIGGVSGWRLPTLVDSGTPGCTAIANSGSDCGYNANTSTSEIAHMFYVTLGNKGQISPSGATQSGFGLTNAGAFANLQTGPYWTGTEVPSTGYAWFFGTGKGIQNVGQQGNAYFAWAVHAGDVAAATGVTSPVPEPESLALALAGIGVTMMMRRRSK
jgi:hypothetical protein